MNFIRKMEQILHSLTKLINFALLKQIIMKTLRLIAGLIIIISFSTCTVTEINKTLNSLSTTSNTGTLTNTEIIQGLKEALKVGTNNSVTSTSKVDGFFKNTTIKIPWPADAATAETKLRALGMGTQVDKVVETLNRGAEEAAKSAAPIFLKAITDLTITDGLTILKGANNAATEYLKTKTTSSLTTAFLPTVKTALSKVEITKYWTPLTTTYNAIPLVTPVNTDLNNYVTGKAIDGLFKIIAAEELKIRTDPTARITDILKKVFAK
jgi:hypothetical protein